MDLLINFTGIFLGAFLAYLFTLKFEKKKKKERLLIVVPIVIQDLEINLRNLETAKMFCKNCVRLQKEYSTTEDSVEKEKRAVQIAQLKQRIELRLVFKKDIFLGLINYLLLLPKDVAHKVVNCYTYTEKVKSEFSQALLEDDWPEKLSITEGKRESTMTQLNETIVLLQKMLV